MKLAVSAIWRLATALSNTRPISSPYETPAAWIDENRTQIQKVLDDTETPALASSDLPGLGKLLYPRLTTYTYARLKLFSADTSALDLLIEKLEEWAILEDIAQLVHHASIQETLRECLITSGKITLSERTRLLQLHHLDVLCVMARVLTISFNLGSLKQLVNQTGEDAQSLLNILQALLDSEHLGAILELSKKSCLFPDNLVLRGVEKEGHSALDGGSFGDIWQGSFAGKAVAIKVMRRLHGGINSKTAKIFNFEAVLWRQFHHPNVLSFYGVHLWPQDPRPVICLISPWMSHGNILEYLKRNPNADRLSLIFDIASGLQYLHEFDPPVVHGDMKGRNILITPSLRACVADFGLCTLKPDPVINFTPTSSNWKSGTFGYLAPEILMDPSPDIKDEHKGRKTLASDVYAFGVVVYEIFTGRTRYHGFPVVNEIMATIQNVQTPKPVLVDDQLWDLVEKCWEKDAKLRPSIGIIVKELTSYLALSESPSNDSLEWDESIISRLRSSVLDPACMFPKTGTDIPDLPTFLNNDGEPLTDIKSGDIVIAVMGPSGTGKSSFVNTVMGRTVATVDGRFESCTQDVQTFGCMHPNGNGQKIVIVDTPGFDDTNKTDYEVLEEIAKWLEQTYRKRITLSGILQFHSIQEARMRGTPRRNLEMFQRLCGATALKNVVLLTTYWDQVSGSVGSTRETQLMAQFWETLTRHGSRVERFDPPTYERAWDLINYFQTPAHSSHIPEPKPALTIQVEIVDEGKQLYETSAFGFLVQFWTRIVDTIRGKARAKVQNVQSPDLARAMQQKGSLEKGLLRSPSSTKSIGSIGEKQKWFTRRGARGKRAS
ncbi:kinase-like domain-containing protein [Flammula alnicola]|nr:kinase-like domain-containing protein [Flammula alnicola]